MTTPDTFALLPLHLVIPSLTNPRKTFNRARLDELVASIAASGVHQPILVRPLPGSRVEETSKANHRGQKHQGYVPPTHEIVAGERRYRASVEANLPTIPALIRPLTDAQVLEIQLVENLQRDDLTELEEAEGYERLMQATGETADAIGGKIGKSRSYVYARLKLLDLCQEAKQALREGHIDASRALLIARIPDGKLQIKATAYAADKHDAGGDGQQPSVRDLQTWLRQNVMLPLDRAPFLIAEARLIPEAGSCKDCPKRTGAAPDIFADVVGADICTDPPCYNHKAEAHTARLQASADKQGLRLIAGAEAKTVCYEKSSTLNGYSPLSQVRQDAGGQRLDELIGRTPEGGVLIENPWTHELIKAVPTKEAEGLLLAKGLVKAIEAPAGKSDHTAASYAAAVQKIKASADARIRDEYEVMLKEKTFQAVINTEDEDLSELTDSSVLLAHFGPELKYAAGGEALAALDLDDAKPESLNRSQIYKVTALYMAAGDPAVQEAIAKLKGIHLGRLREDAKEEVKAKVALEIAALKKPPKPTAPLAQPGTVPAADAKPKKPVPLRKPKLSAQDAQLGIAAAMQGMEEGAPAVAVESGTVDQVVADFQPGQHVFAVGQQVRVTTDTDKLGLIAVKHAGRTGTITAREPGGGWWTVTFKGRHGGLVLMGEDQIEAVAA